MPSVVPANLHVVKALVTGAAGFIGSTLAERLVADGWSVRGVDRFTAYYEEGQKRANIAGVVGNPAFQLVEADLLTAAIEPLLADVDVVFHLAAQPGVRLSWADGFRLYNDLNVNVTQRLLEVCSAATLQRFVYASSSSVYGQSPQYPTDEESPTRPHSPYGVTKLAAELLCGAYAENFGVPITSLRYFTVYGPRQRPDMAIHRMIEAARRGTAFPLFGDGSHVRDFTFVDDVARATMMAGTAPLPAGTVLNVAGGSQTKVSDLIDLVGDVVGHPVPVQLMPGQHGDVSRTGGAIDRAEQLLGWQPRVSLRDGVSAQAEWHRRAMPLP